MKLGDYIRSCNNFQLAVLFSQLDNIKNVAETYDEMEIKIKIAMESE